MSDDAIAQWNLTVLNGESVTSSFEGRAINVSGSYEGDVFVNFAKVVRFDIVVGNFSGFIHVIDQVCNFSNC